MCGVRGMQTVETPYPRCMTAEVAERLDEIRRRAEAAANKPAGLGPDVDLDEWRTASARSEIDSLDSLQRQVRETALMSGFVTDESQRSASYFQMDRSTIYERVMAAYDNQIEVMGSDEALLAWPDEMAEKYWWRAVAPDKDKYTALVALHQTGGYFIRVRADQHVDRPIQACLFISESDVTQNLHNIIVVEDGGEANVITGCNVEPGVREGLHAGISEFYIGRGASLTFTMVHNWGEHFTVRPRTGVVVAEGGTYVSNYVLLRPVRSLQAFPTCRLEGDGSTAAFTTIVCGLKDSYVDLGTEVLLIGRHTRCEAIARTVTKDRSTVYSRGRLIAMTDECTAHLDCRGILQSASSTQWAIPELSSEGAPGAELSHEAAISPIAQEEVYYLMSRGVPRDEAISMITRGFMSVDIPGLPGPLRRRIDEAIAEASGESL